MPDQLNNFPALEGIYKSLELVFKDSVLEYKFEKNELSAKIKKEDVLTVFRFLKEEKGFNVLNDIICVDHLNHMTEGQKRFSILYQLYRYPGFERIRITIDLNPGEQIDSIIPIYKSSNWGEREIYDMFGIQFSGHPDMRRIYMWDDFKDFPLRKDYPLEGRE